MFSQTTVTLHEVFVFLMVIFLVFAITKKMIRIRIKVIAKNSRSLFSEDNQVTKFVFPDGTVVQKNNIGKIVVSESGITMMSEDGKKETIISTVGWQKESILQDLIKEIPTNTIHYLGKNNKFNPDYKPTLS